jgi:PadR family transcriptional regulator, regulatory protein PadR
MPNDSTDRGGGEAAKVWGTNSADAMNVNGTILKGREFLLHSWKISERRLMDQIGQLEQLVMLAILRLQPTAYGVSLQKELELRTGREYSVGAIYAVLDKLERKGFVKTKQGEATPERGGRAKLYFNLTAPGQTALQASLKAIDDLRSNTRFAPVLP